MIAEETFEKRVEVVHHFPGGIRRVESAELESFPAICQAAHIDLNICMGAV